MKHSRILGKLDFNEDLLQHDLNLIDSFPIIEEEYSEFGTGTWLNHSLWTDDGDYKNTQYKDFNTSAKTTALGKQLNYINSVIKEYFDIKHIKMARMRNLIDGVVVPHKDFVELSRSKNSYIRVFIPLEDNFHAYHSDETGVFRMRKGEVWFLDASIVHAAANFSKESRKCLCLDFQYENNESGDLSIIFNDKKTYNPDIKPCIINRTFAENLKPYLDKLAKEINVSNYAIIFYNLSKLHFFYDYDIKNTFTWLIEIAEKSNQAKLLDKIKHLQTYMIENRSFGERFDFSL